MDITLFRTELQELFDKHKVRLEGLDISPTDDFSLKEVFTVQVRNIMEYKIMIGGKFNEIAYKY